ncbi:MAG: lipoate--protein ligase family protein [Candidatus Omnitrophica bacterium]|jgi:lipoate-protein ligase A|nr:lipoate--protein ligase family protein [Candidatus Omnitrophota bacterium]
MKKFKLIRSGLQSASFNMALDEKIFNQYLEDRIPVFRVYGWKNPSFTYGFSQTPDDEINLDRCIACNVEVVKRITGGGILFHWHEITYSFACSKEDINEPEGLLVGYRSICRFLLDFYKKLNLEAKFSVELDSFLNKNFPHELCCASHEKYDVTISGKKIGGNAQKRKRDCIFQHGSIPFSIDWKLLESYLKKMPLGIKENVTSLSEQFSSLPERNILEDKLIDSFSDNFGVEFYETSLVK